MKDNNLIKRSFHDSFNGLFKSLQNKFGAHNMWVIEWQEFLKISKEANLEVLYVCMSMIL